MNKLEANISFILDVMGEATQNDEGDLLTDKLVMLEKVAARHSESKTRARLEDTIKRAEFSVGRVHGLAWSGRDIHQGPKAAWAIAIFGRGPAARMFAVGESVRANRFDERSVCGLSLCRTP